MVQKQKSEKTKKEHYPRLNTILMVEDTLKTCDYSAITIAKLKKILPKKINHNVLMLILDYLDKSNKIYIGVKGITWIKNNNPNLREAIRTGMRL